jgi:hypothetical protein
MRRSTRLKAKSPAFKHARLHKFEECVKAVMSPQNIAKASAGAGAGMTIAALPVGIAISPLLGLCLAYLGATPAIFGLLGIREQDVQKMNAKQRKAYIEKKVREYVKEQKERAAKAQRTRASGKKGR